MSSTWILTLITSTWILIYLAHRHFTKHIPSYSTLLHTLGLSISLFHIKWQTRSLNPLFHRLATSAIRRYLRLWFGLGVAASLCLMIFSIFYLTLSIWRWISTSSPSSSLSPSSSNQTVMSPVPSSGLTPMLPGLTLPVEDLPPFFSSLLLATTLHEMGHAVAAVRERVHLDSFNLFIMFIFPAASVDVHTDNLLIISPLRQLRVFCAGVWHNLVLTLLTLLLLPTLPYLLSPLYQVGGGVTVTSIHPAYSTLSGPGGLSPGITITSVGSCKVADGADWWRCLVADGEDGWCVSGTDVRTHSHHLTLPVSGEGECCKAEAMSRGMCFTGLRSTGRLKACLPARWVLHHPRCGLRGGGECVRNLCLRAVTLNSTRLLQIFTQDRRDEPILHVGNPRDVFWAISTTDWRPRFPSILPVGLPESLDKFLRYLASISAALATLNVVPCYALDGQHIVTTLVETILPRTSRVTRVITSSILWLGTFLILSNILISIKVYIIDGIHV